MTGEQLQQQCELGQRQLMATQYLDAVQTLEAAEQVAWDAKDFDTLSRLYLPLQEARRQVRQRCGEGIVKLDCIASAADDELDVETFLREFPHGQMLIAGWGSIAPALRMRALARQNRQYVEAFLAAVFPLIGGARVVVIVPLDDARLPDAQPRSIDSLLAMLPPHSIVLGVDELPRGQRRGDTQTYGQIMSLWERLHAPFLAAADLEVDPLRKMQAYRKTIRVDCACELAHQKLADVAKKMIQKH
jgi:hypothetical protein